MRIDFPPKRFYFDDGHFTYWEKPWRELSVYTIGGYSIDFDKEKELDAELTEIKKKYKLEPRHPIKWNLRDTNVQKYYRERGEEEIYARLLETSDEIRGELLDIVSGGRLGITPFACSLVRLKIKDKPLKSYQRCFTNLLQRISMNVGTTDDRHTIFMDYFKDEDASALMGCYSCGYHSGKDTEGNVYRAGCLEEKGFYQSMYFGKTLYNQFLQLADLTTGCVSDFAEYCFKRKDFQKVMKFFPKIVDKFPRVRGRDDPFKAGIVIRPDEHYQKLEKGLAEVKQALEEVSF